MRRAARRAAAGRGHAVAGCGAARGRPPLGRLLPAHVRPRIEWGRSLTAPTEDPWIHGLRDRRALHRHQGQLVCRGVPGRLHPSDARRAGLRPRRAALHRSRGVHRLRRVRRGLPGRRVLRRGPAARRVARFRAAERRRTSRASNVAEGERRGTKPSRLAGETDYTRTSGRRASRASRPRRARLRHRQATSPPAPAPRPATAPASPAARSATGRRSRARPGGSPGRRGRPGR